MRKKNSRAINLQFYSFRLQVENYRSVLSRATVDLKIKIDILRTMDVILLVGWVVGEDIYKVIKLIYLCATNYRYE